MILYTINSYANTRKDGKLFYHESKDKAVVAAAQNNSEYLEIGTHIKKDVLRCDPCKALGEVSAAEKPLRVDGVDHCQECFKKLNSK